MSNETVARRYATALADVVVKSGETGTVTSELNAWVQMITTNAELENVLRNPVVQHIKKEKVLESLLERVKPSKTTANFLRILLKNDRLADIGTINERFLQVLEERSGTVSAEIISSRDLSEGERTELRSNLEKLTGKRINPSWRLDPELIGGVVTRIGSTVYDGSVKTQLETLKEELVNA
jgi:F-type H+-transporting ATPase subunit delta